jgi:hypothetical protein
MLKENQTLQKLAEPFLHEICDVCHATSVWLLRHDFNKRLATVVGEYASDAANTGEKIGEIIGEQYPEAIQSAVWTWLRGVKPQFMQFHTDDISPDELEYFEYLEDDVKSIGCFAVYDGDDVWGFVEVWDTRQKHDFSAEEIAATSFVRRIEQLI